MMSHYLMADMLQNEFINTLDGAQYYQCYNLAKDELRICGSTDG